MKTAVNHLFNFSKDEQMRILEEAKDKNRRDRIAEKEYVFEQGIEKGKEQGIELGKEQGIELGKEQGIKQGMKKKEEALVLNMLSKGLSVKDIAKWTGLKAQQVVKIQKRK